MMERARGDRDVKLLACINPVRGRWAVRWDVRQLEDGTAEYMEAVLEGRPSPEEVRGIISSWVNGRTDERIRTGFSWEGMPVYLSAENQRNFKAAYDIAVQTAGANLPVRFKLGEDAGGRPVYHTFTTVEEFGDFHTKAVGHITRCLDEGWQEKDGINIEQYYG